MVGILADSNQFWFQREPRPVMYVPFTQTPPRAIFLAIRGSGDPTRLLPTVRKRLRRIDSTMPLYNPSPMDKLMLETMAAMRITTGMMTVFGVLETWPRSGYTA